MVNYRLKLAAFGSELIDKVDLLTTSLASDMMIVPSLDYHRFKLKSGVGGLQGQIRLPK